MAAHGAAQGSMAPTGGRALRRYNCRLSCSSSMAAPIRVADFGRRAAFGLNVACRRSPEAALASTRHCDGLSGVAGLLCLCTALSCVTSLGRRAAFGLNVACHCSPEAALASTRHCDGLSGVAGLRLPLHGAVLRRKPWAARRVRLKRTVYRCSPEAALASTRHCDGLSGVAGLRLPLHGAVLRCKPWTAHRVRLELPACRCSPEAALASTRHCDDLSGVARFICLCTALSCVAGFGRRVTFGLNALYTAARLQLLWRQRATAMACRVRPGCFVFARRCPASQALGGASRSA